MEKRDPTSSDDPTPDSSASDIVTRLDEAEAGGRFIDGMALVHDLRRMAEELKVKTARRKA